MFRTLLVLIAALEGASERVETEPLRFPEVQRPTQRLSISNPEGATLILRRIGEDEAELALPVSQSHTLELPVGRYRLDARFEDGSAQALPIPALVGEPLAVELVEAPSSPDGYVFVPAGPFLRGDRLGIGQADEGVARVEHCDAFFIARDEVSKAEYCAFLNARLPSAGERALWIDLDRTSCGIAFDDEGGYRTDPELATHPVVNVSWHGAVAYCLWRSDVESATVRLPREPEWEKAARGPSSSVFAYGDRYSVEAANQESGSLSPRGAHPARGFGARDMTGNAYEWLEDLYDSEDKAGYRNLRGGSFVLDGVYLRCAFRMRYHPETMADDIGFRVLREVSRERDR